MKVEFREYVGGTRISHVPLSLLDLQAPTEPVTDGQEWLAELCKIAARTTLYCAREIHTSEQYQVLVQSVEGSAEELLGLRMGQPPQHPPEHKFECAYLALLLAISGKQEIHIRPREMRKVPKALEKLLDLCLIWRHINEVRSGLDTLKRFAPAVHLDLAVVVWVQGGRLLALDTSSVNDKLNRTVIPKHFLRESSFQVPGLREVVPDFEQQFGSAMAPTHGAHPWTLQMLVELENRGVLTGKSGKALFLRTKEEWIASINPIASHLGAISSEFAKMNEPERTTAFTALLNRYLRNLRDISARAVKAAEEDGHYLHPIWLPVALAVQENPSRESILIPLRTNEFLHGRFVAHLFANPDQFPLEKAGHRLVGVWARAWEQIVTQRQVQHALGSMVDCSVLSTIGDRYLAATQFEGELCGLSMKAKVSPHPLDKRKCGDLDIVVIDTKQKEIRVVEVKRLVNDKELRDLGVTYEKFWTKRRPAFLQLLRKLQWVEHYRSRMKFPPSKDSMANWTVRGCLMVTAAPRVLWITNRHFEAVCELGSEKAKSFLSGTDPTIGVESSRLSQACLHLHRGVSLG